MSIAEAQPIIDRIVREIMLLPLKDRANAFDRKIAELPHDLRELATTITGTRIRILDDTMEHEDRIAIRFWIKWSPLIGVILVLLAVCLVFSRDNLSGPQWDLVKILASIGSACFLSIATGFLNVRSTIGVLSLNAGGGLAVFFLLYFYSPAEPTKGFQTSPAMVEATTNAAVSTNATPR